MSKYKEGNNRPSTVNQTSFVHNQDKAGNRCYAQDNTNTRYENRCLGIGKLLLLWPRIRR